MIWEALLLGALLPGATSAAFWAFCIKPWKRDAVPRAGGSLAIATGYIVGHVAIGAPYRGSDVVALLPYFAAIGAMIGIVEFAIVNYPRTIIFLKLAASFVLTISIVWLLPAVREGEIDIATRALVWAPALSFIVWFFTTKISANVAGPVPGFYLWLCAAGAAGILLQSGNAKLAQLLGACAAGVAPSAICGFFSKSPLHSRGATATFFIIYNSAITIGHFFGELPGGSAYCLGFAPLAAFIGFPNIVKKRRVIQPFRAWSYIAGFIAIAAALGAAYGFLPKSEEY